MNRRTFIKTGSAAVAATAFGGYATAGGADKLAILGGTPVLGEADAGRIRDMFAWPIVNDAMRKASDDVLVQRKMSGRDIAIEFERRFAAWNGAKYALCTPNGTSALNGAFYAVGVKPGDEVICPSITMWASCSGAVNLGATVVFCDVKPDDLTIDPKSFEERITPRTKAVVVVHYMGAPCDMDAVMAIARKHGIKVIEDVSHAQGGLYKGRKLGTIGDAAGMSLMSGKSFAIGEAGMFLTNDEQTYKRFVRWGMYIRIPGVWGKGAIGRTLDVPFGGVKLRLNQCVAAIGIEQLKKYDAECAEIEKAMRYYWKGISDVKGLKMIYPKFADSNKAGWYSSRCLYDPAAFGGLSNKVFAAALSREAGGFGGAGCNFPLHLSSVYDDEDIFGDGLPPVRRGLAKGVSPKSLWGSLPVAEATNAHVIGDPWFRHFDPALIDKYVEAVHKVAANYKSLLGMEDNSKYSYWPA